jgi:cyclohexadienyl dehydratase
MRPLRLAAVVAVLVLAAGCDSTTTTPPTGMQTAGGLPQLLQRGSVRVCSTSDYRPFTFRDSQGNWSRLDIEMAHDMAARLGVQLDLVPTIWASLINDMGNKCDVAMGGISITLDRAKHAGYSAAYLRDGKAAIVRCDDRSSSRTWPTSTARVCAWSSTPAAPMLNSTRTICTSRKWWTIRITTRSSIN